jgi:18S rRNA (guanine1575-N7)-methyltransferase
MATKTTRKRPASPADEADVPIAAAPAAAPERMRDIVVKMSNDTERTVGTFPTHLHSDIRTVILGIRRGLRKKGRAVTLNAERTAVVERALAEYTPHGSIAGLNAAFIAWTDEMLLASAAGINTYYNEERSAQYTEHNAVPQEMLSQLVWQLQHELSTSRAGLTLDLGSGSGLSSAAFERLGAPLRTIGCDLSLAMLAIARKSNAALDYVQADISKPLPFRDGAFAAALSVSTVQHLCKPGADGCTPSERLRCLFGEVVRALEPGRAVGRSVAVQFHVDGSADARLIRDAARDAGLACDLVVDQPYQSVSRRWFLTAAPQRAPDRRARACALYWDTSGGCATCILAQHAQLGSASLLDAERVTWSSQEHLRAANRWVRVRRRERAHDGARGGGEVRSTLTDVQAGVADAIQTALGADADMTALKANTDAVLALMHARAVDEDDAPP